MTAAGTARDGRGASLAWRALRSVSLGITLVVVVATLLAYRQVEAGLESQALASLRTTIEERRARESMVFTHAGANLDIAATSYDRQLTLTGFPDVRHRFDVLFDRHDDGTLRVAEDVFWRTGVTGFIGKHVLVDDDLKRRIVAGYDVLARLGPAFRAGYTNFYMVLPEPAVLMFWPDTPWALEASDWQLFGKLDLLSQADHPLPAEGTVPHAEWSDLYYDYGAAEWVVSALRPVSENGRLLASFGQDLLLNDLMTRIATSEPGGPYSLLVRDDGRLIAHPRFMEAVQASSGQLTVARTGDAHLARTLDLAREGADDVIVENRTDGEVLAVTRLDGPGWFLITAFPRALLSDQAFRTARLVMALGLLALVIELVILSWVLRRHVSAPLKRLTGAARAVAAGRPVSDLDTVRRDEVGILSRAFEEMAQRIDARERALTAQKGTLADLNAQLRRELDERARAERELRNQRELLALLNVIDYGILFLDRDLRIRIGNRAYRELWNIPESLATPGTPVRMLFDVNRHAGLYDVPDAEWEAYVAGRMAAIRAGPTAPREMKRLDGRTILYRVVALPDGGRMLTYQDVTAERRAMEALHAAERRHRRLLEAAPFPLTVTRQDDGTILYANGRMAEVAGIPLNQLLGAPGVERFIAPEHRAMLKERLQRTGRAEQCEVRLRLPSGREFWALVNAVQTEHEGQPAVIAGFHDISILKQREQELRDASALKDAALRDLNAVLDTIDYGVLFCGPDLKARLANRAYREIWGIPQDFYDHPRTLRQDLEQSMRAGLYPVTREQWPAYLEDRIEEVRAGGIPSRELALANGRIIQFHGIALPDGGRMLTYFDITELKQAEAALRRTVSDLERSRAALQRQAAVQVELAQRYAAEKRRAEDASRTKSQFLANMSHELRTPMNAIIGFTRIVLRRGRDVLPERQVGNLEKILASANHLLSLINQVLDLSKIEAGQMDVRPVRFALPPLVEQSLRTVEPMIRRPGRVRLETDLDPALPDLLADQGKVRQILLNLLSNAVKFTEAGTVTVSARAVAEGVEITVTDTGIGIPEDARELVFDEFRQVDGGPTRAHGGTGLGLSISRRLARLMGGDITLADRPGGGSVFRVILPPRAVAPDPAETGEAVS
ncbi:hypothetical protein C882_0307 [Caenispirillum salinarum AK4]|uniref:histidine kinase n=1 Tax=Caenispirillum salinarum AK4 TaxID=1238182 RepID=K9GU17_9PROT|nr:PAS-domain containing protein [Caenispirillum salinarum]EKV29485.1 hypothetical protein C882_0307 [Caenispirillum salinarum AK4]